MKKLFLGAMILAAASANAATDFSSVVSVENLASTAEVKTATGITNIYSIGMLGMVNGDVAVMIGGPSFVDYYSLLDLSGTPTASATTDLDAQDDNTDFRRDNTETTMAPDGTVYVWDYTGSTAADNLYSIATNGTMTLEVASEDFPGLTSLAYVDATSIAYARHDHFGGNQGYGIVDLSTDTVIEKGILTGVPETIVYDGVNFFIMTETTDIIRVDNFLSGTPAEVDVTPTGWSGLDVNNFALGPDGEFIITDVAGNIRIWDGSAETVISYASLETTGSLDTGIVNPVNDGGLLVDNPTAITTDLYISNYGSAEDALTCSIFRVSFNRTTAVQDWTLF